MKFWYKKYHNKPAGPEADFILKKLNGAWGIFFAPALISKNKPILGNKSVFFGVISKYNQYQNE